MKLNSQDLKNIAVLTLQHYNEHADDFLRGTRDHDVSQNIAALLQYIDGKPPDNRFDGVFANAALFHVPRQELPRVLLELHAALKPRGALFSSNPNGHNEEGWAGGRYGAYYDLETWHRFMLAAGFLELTHYYRPAGLPREQQPWLASVWRR